MPARQQQAPTRDHGRHVDLAVPARVEEADLAGDADRFVDVDDDFAAVAAEPV